MCKPDKTMKPISAQTTAKPTKDTALTLTSLRKALPEDVFVKSLVLSLYYLLFDAAMWAGSLYVALLVTKSDSWKSLELWQQTLFSFLYWNFAGFFMWCLFVRPSLSLYLSLTPSLSLSLSLCVSAGRGS
jgi:hypothetical protein